MATTIEQLHCLVCGYRWLPRTANRPVKCPECQSRKWDKTKTETQQAA